MIDRGHRPDGTRQRRLLPLLIAAALLTPTAAMANIPRVPFHELPDQGMARHHATGRIAAPAKAGQTAPAQDVVTDTGPWALPSALEAAVGMPPCVERS